MEKWKSLQKVELGKLDSYMQKNETGTLSNFVYKNSKYIKPKSKARHYETPKGRHR